MLDRGRARRQTERLEAEKARESHWFGGQRRSHTE